MRAEGPSGWDAGPAAVVTENHKLATRNTPTFGSWFDMAENGPITTTVANAVLMLSVMAARPELAAVPAPDSVGVLRIAVSVKAPAPLTPVDPHFVGARRATADLLSSLGHVVREAEPTYPTGTALAALARWFAGAELDARLLADRSRREPRVAPHAAAGRIALRVRAVPAGQPRGLATHGGPIHG